VPIIYYEKVKNCFRIASFSLSDCQTDKIAGKNFKKKIGIIKSDYFKQPVTLKKKFSFLWAKITKTKRTIPSSNRKLATILESITETRFFGAS